METIRIGATVIVGILIFSLACTSINGEIGDYLHNGDPGFFEIIILGAISLGILIFSLPAIIYLSVVEQFFYNSSDIWMWDNGFGFFFGRSFPLFIILLLVWLPVLRPISGAWISEILVAISPSHAARKSHAKPDSNNAFSRESQSFSERAPSKAERSAIAEEVERQDLAAELERAVSDLEAKKARLDEYQQDRKRR